MADGWIKVSVAGSLEVEQTLRLARDNIERDTGPWYYSLPSLGLCLRTPSGTSKRTSSVFS